MSLGIRQLRDENWQFYPWVNAPPGRPQRMGVFFLLSAGAPETALRTCSATRTAIAFARSTATRRSARTGISPTPFRRWRNGLDWTPPFKPVLKAMGVDASMIMDFHGDGHPDDLTDLRLDELHAYFAALRAQSDPDFLLIPAEEANVHLGGHWALVFPKPVYWFMNRPEGRRVRLDASEIRHGLQRGRRAGDARPRAPRGRLHVPDASTDEGIDRVSRSRF